MGTPCTFADRVIAYKTESFTHFGACELSRLAE